MTANTPALEGLREDVARGRKRLRVGLTASLTIMVERLSAVRDGERRWEIYLEVCDKLEAHFQHAGWQPPKNWPDEDAIALIAERTANV
jgi:hypothetical protein